MRVSYCLLIGLVCGLRGGGLLPAADAPRVVSFVTDAAPGRAARHGVGKLQAALQARGWRVEPATTVEAARGGLIVVAGTTAGNGAAARLLRETGGTPPGVPEALTVKKVRWRDRPALVLCGADDRGLMYAALDAADRVGWAGNAADPFSEVGEAAEQPFVRDRSLSVYTMNRRYWESRFYDEQYWARYFDLLAANRFNRFVIVFGYENGGFMAPPYPYFFDTRGFQEVRMENLTPEQQRRNLTALNRLIELAHDRGIAVGVGIWDHIYRGGVQAGGAEWVGDYRDRPVPDTVQGLTTANLNDYTLAALEEFLASVPGLDSVQFRIHEESGLKRAEMDAFWRQVFQLVQRARPGLLVEARAKGTPDSVIDAAFALGVNLRIETKYWMEQMGLPFHPTHVNPQNQRDRRHGYADLLRYPQRYQINWRLWNGGTTRVLLWGDPEYVRRYSASTQLYASPNWDVQEPLATKMEAQPPGVPPFVLLPPRYRYYDYEFERYWHFYQVWGRVGYNPDTPSDVWRREFVRRFGPAAAPHVEAGLHRASQVLPMIVAAVYPYRLFPTTRGWAERQTLGASLAEYATNTGTDIQQFESFAEAADRIVSGGVTPRRTPAATSRWLDETADAVLAAVAQAEQGVGTLRGKEFDATTTDLRILAGLARFHARRAEAAVHYLVYERTKELHELHGVIAGESAAVEAWRGIVDAAGDRYPSDLMMGARNHNLCQHWRDELVKLQQSLAAQVARRRTMDLTRDPPGGVAHVAVRKTAPARDLEVLATAAVGSRLRVGYGGDAAGGVQWFPMTEAATGEFRAVIPAAAVRPGLYYAIEARGSAGGQARFPADANSFIRPVVSTDVTPPAVGHEPVKTARPGQPLQIVARVTDPSGIQSVRLRYRPVTQFEDYATLDMQPTGAPDTFAAVVPGEALRPQWDFMYFLEVLDQAGNGAMFPDLAKTMPYVIVKLER
jgi:hypothetical protein